MTSARLVNGILDCARRFRLFRDSPVEDVITDVSVALWAREVSRMLPLSMSASLQALGPDHSQFHNLQSRFIWMARWLQAVPWLERSTRSELAMFVESRPKYVPAKYKITYDSFTTRIPQLSHDLERFVARPNLRFLEIGSFEGHSACWLLENILTDETSRLTCVDLFPKPSKALFDHNLDIIGARHRVETFAGKSRDVLPALVDRRYDFIYVDGSHDQSDVLEDAVLAWRLLTRGGVLTFDDYLLKDVPITQIVCPQRPDIGIDAFLSAYDGHYREVSKGFQLTITKI